MAKEVPKYGIHEQIQFAGVKDLSPEEQDTVRKLSTEYYAKVKRSVKNTTSLLVHVKCYCEGGTRKKYSLHIRLTCPSRVFEADKHHDFDLARAVHRSFEALLNEVHHAFYTDVSGKTHPR